VNWLGLKKVVWTTGQPGEFTTTQATTPNTAMVLTLAIRTAAPRDRRSDRRGAEVPVGG